MATTDISAIGRIVPDPLLAHIDVPARRRRGLAKPAQLPTPSRLRRSAARSQALVFHEPVHRVQYVVFHLGGDDARAVRLRIAACPQSSLTKLVPPAEDHLDDERFSLSAISLRAFRSAGAERPLVQRRRIADGVLHGRFHASDGGVLGWYM